MRTKQIAPKFNDSRHRFRSVSLITKFTCLLISLLMAVVLCEIGLRTFWTNPYRSELPDRIVDIRMQNSCANRILDRSAINPTDSKVAFRTDERGYLLPSRQSSNPTSTVAFLGGSTTECSAVREELRFPALVSTLLQKQGLRVNTLNAGRSGNTLHDSINLLINRVALDRPDVLVAMHATNDAGVLRQDPNYASRSSRNLSGRDAAKWLLQTSSSHTSLLGLARQFMAGRASRIEPAAMFEQGAAVPASVLAQYRSRLKIMVHVCRDLKITPVLMTQPLADASNELAPTWSDMGAQDLFNSVIREVADEQDLALIDLAIRIKERIPNWNQPNVLFYDGMHVNDRGSEIYAQVIAEHLWPVLNEQ